MTDLSCTLPTDVDNHKLKFNLVRSLAPAARHNARSDLDSKFNSLNVI
eukprot:SAG31_NODE_111_length_24443_cov_231.743685_13_plen_48_part_00